MKIKQIDVYQVTYGLQDHEYAWSGGHSVTTLVSTIVKVSTAEGISGFGEVCPLGSGYMDAYARGVPSGIEEVGELLIGEDPTRIHAINALMDSALGGHKYVKSVLDIACWDIIGKAAELPVCTLLGGRYVANYPLYRAISQNTPEKMADDVARFRSEGYRRFQLKVGAQPDDDIRRIQAALEKVQEGDILIADANTGWLQHEAIRVVNALADRDFYVEQPCPSLDECLVIRGHTRLPIVLDEVMTGVEPFMQAYENRAMDAINIKISRVGGMTKAKQLRDLCEILGIIMTIEDSWGGDITTASIAHLAGSTKPEFLFTSTDFNSYIDVRVAEDAPFRKNGRLSVPTGPGLGITVDESKLGIPVLTVRS